MKTKNLKAISLFSSGGLGDLALKNNNVDILVSNELLPDRHKVFQNNFPNTETITGDIWENKDAIINKTLQLLKGEILDIVYATPPCQGMSKNGMGKLLNGVKKGLKQKFDPRNRLIIPTIDICISLQPKTILLENVSEICKTYIQDNKGNVISIVDYIENKLGKEYVGRPHIIEFADYGVPQYRKRAILIYTRDVELKSYFFQNRSLVPARTHSKYPVNNEKKWITLNDTIRGLPYLSGKDKVSAKSSLPYHYVPVLAKDKYHWISNTKPEKGALDNQCIKCGYDGNPSHSSKKDSNGTNSTKHNQTIYCIKCNSLLPRPSVYENCRYRLMKAYTSSYKRMKWSEPASTITRNLSYACSDKKLHPEQDRVLSLYEAFLIHTITDFKYEWGEAPDKVIREVLGEGVPPRGLNIILKHIINLDKEPSRVKMYQKELAYIT